MSEAARSRAARDTTWRAFVLHRYDWSESSLILDLFTREGGRVVAAAKGAKRPSSSLRPVLLPFQPLQVLLSRRHVDDDDEVLTLRSAEWGAALLSGAAHDVGGNLQHAAGVNLHHASDAAPRHARSVTPPQRAVASGVTTHEHPDATSTLLRGEALFRGFYVNELLMKLLARGDAHPALFDVYALTLAALASAHGEGQAQAALRAFELTLLQEIGWLPDLSAVTSTVDAVRAGGGYTLRAESGLTPGGVDAIDGEHWLRMHAALSDRAYGELRHACEHDGVASLRAMLRQVLASHLGHVSLRTRDVALGLRRLARR